MNIVVAIPARNEADRIIACLDALAGQPQAARHIAGVVVFANNCTDATAAIARQMRDARRLPFALEVIEARLPPEQAHVGWARRGATEAAAAHLRSLGLGDGIIAGTDADSRVAAGWLDAIVAAFSAGVDAVAGAIDLDRGDPGASSATLSGLAAVRAAEAAYADAVARTNARLDPLPHDPWPNHIWAWGANLAVRAPVLAAIGGSPPVALAEDRALHAALLRHDARIRHSVSARVWTSARRDGRAPGGLADLLADYAGDPDALADFALEPAAISWQRALLRGRARQRWRSHASGFGARWAAIEARTPGLARQRLPLALLGVETAWLDARLSRCDAAGRSDTPGSVRPADDRHRAAAQQ